MTPLILSLAAFAALTLQQWLHARERQTLLDRIQAPQQVIEKRLAPEPELLEAVHPDLDSDYWLNKGVEVPH